MHVVEGGDTHRYRLSHREGARGYSQPAGLAGLVPAVRLFMRSARLGQPRLRIAIVSGEGCRWGSRLGGVLTGVR